MIPNGPSMVGYGPGGAAVVVTASGLKTAMEPMSFSTFLHDHMIICTYLYLVLGFGCDFVVFFVQDRSDDGQHESNSCGPH